MMSRVLFAFGSLALVAAAPAPKAAAPKISPIAPAEVAADASNRWTLDLSTGGHVVILLRPDVAPAHVAQIKALTRAGFYNGLTFHRVIPGFMAQSGDPKGTGEGGSDLPNIKAEFTKMPFLRGTVGAARSENPDSANSQFFIMYGPNGNIDGKYTAIGRVVEGMSAVDGISPGEPPAEPTKIVRASLGG